jgi:uncharacterized protein YneF (UPF0154 family)
MIEIIFIIISFIVGFAFGIYVYLGHIANGQSKYISEISISKEE